MKLSDALMLAEKLSAAFPRTNFGGDEQLAATMSIYAECLEDLDFEAGKRAVFGLIAESKFFPTVAEIRERVATTEVNSPSSDLAWAEVIKAVHKYGQYRTPEFDDDATAIAVAAVGWRAICLSETIGVERAHFRRAHEAATAQAKRSCNADRLLAAAEARGQLAPRNREGGQLIGLVDVLPRLTKGDA